MKRRHSLTTTALLGLLAVIALSVLPSEARRRCVNCQYGAGMVARYDFKSCRDLDDAGKFKCDDVIFTPPSVNVKDWKK